MDTSEKRGTSRTYLVLHLNEIGIDCAGGHLNRGRLSGKCGKQFDWVTIITENLQVFINDLGTTMFQPIGFTWGEEECICQVKTFDEGITSKFQ